MTKQIILIRDRNAFYRNRRKKQISQLVLNKMCLSGMFRTSNNAAALAAIRPGRFGSFFLDDKVWPKEARNRSLFVRWKTSQMAGKT